jgi:tripartite-type tricarboxylate transporter receptor subunit TctC
MRMVILLLAFWLGAAHAFPTKPVKIIVAFPPGLRETDIQKKIADMGADVVGNAPIKSANIKAE